jgi:hypothetical protein
MRSRQASVGGTGEHQAKIYRPGDVRELPLILGLHQDYELQRSEGVLLRHLNSVYKVLAQTVPDAAKTDPVREMELYLRTMIRQVDSSLLEEWEKMRDPSYVGAAATKEVRPPGAEEAEQDITRDTKGFTAAIRNRIFAFLRGLVIGEYESGLSYVQPSPDSKGSRDCGQIESAVDGYYQEHERICLIQTPATCATRASCRGQTQWRVQQMLVDPEATTIGWRSSKGLGAIAGDERTLPALPKNRSAVEPEVLRCQAK